MAKNTFRTASTCGMRANRIGTERTSKKKGKNPGRREEVQHRRKDEGEQGGSASVPVPGCDGGVRWARTGSVSLSAARRRAGSGRRQAGERMGEEEGLTLWQPSFPLSSWAVPPFLGRFRRNSRCLIHVACVYTNSSIYKRPDQDARGASVLGLTIAHC
eukprot:3190667-Prymnesium_polylepis.1